MTARLTALLVVSAFLLSGCAGGIAPRLSLDTKYGRFSYELPNLEGLKK